MDGDEGAASAESAKEAAHNLWRLRHFGERIPIIRNLPTDGPAETLSVSMLKQTVKTWASACKFPQTRTWLISS